MKTPVKKSLILTGVLALGATLNYLAASSGKKAYDFRVSQFARQSVLPNEAKRHVEILASDEFGGRESGKPGQWLAAKYIAKEFARYGLKPVGNSATYYQNFTLHRQRLVSAEFSLRFPVADGYDVIHYASGDEFVPFSFTGTGQVSAPVVFAGYGITAPEYGYDDYENLNVQGKIVLVLRHEPREDDPDSPFDGSHLTRHAYFETKAENAAEHGAIGMLLVTDPASNHNGDRPQISQGFVSGRNGGSKTWVERSKLLEAFPALWIDSEVSSKLFGGDSTLLKDLQRAIEQNLQPRSFQIQKAEAQVGISLIGENRETQNVAGLIEGNDPVLKDEVVVVGAHYDHVGIINGHIHNGADDNASGTAGLLEIAQAFSELPSPPRRSVLLVAFTAEELGLLGSQYYVEHPLFPLDKTVAMINLDMIGRNEVDDVSVIGCNRSPELHAINIRANGEVGLNLKYNGERFFGRSDQASFARHEIPVIFYNTEGHEDYHRPSDDSDKVNPEKIARISRLAFLVAWEVANSDTRPTYRKLRFR